MYEHEFKYDHDSSSESSSMGNSLGSGKFLRRDFVSGSDEYQNRSNSLESSGEDRQYIKADIKPIYQPVSSGKENNYKSKDLVEELAQQKLLEKSEERGRRIRYQVFIFSIAYLLNFTNNLR